MVALNTDNKQGIDPLTGSLICVEIKKESRFRQPDKFRMRDVKFSTIGQMELKRPERGCSNQSADFVEHSEDVTFGTHENK